MGLTILENTNLWDVPADAYAQGCNMKGKMGAGIAIQFKTRYPAMYKEHVLVCDGLPVPLTPGGLHYWKDPILPDVYNLFTQVYTGKDGRLEACESAFNVMFNHAKQHGINTIAMPAIGCGLAGLRWKDVKFVLQQCITKSDFPGEVIVAFMLKEMNP
jgi:O-acetyl-ADP-ribose deacetylase (regulator of RNase III)